MAGEPKNINVGIWDVELKPMTQVFSLGFFLVDFYDLPRLVYPDSF